MCSQEIEDLHTRVAVQIDDCSQLLERVEGRLGHFDKELNTVNKEIQSLEEDSDQLSVMLKNRVHAAEKLGSWLQDTTVPPSLVHAVVDGDVADGKRFTATLKAVKSKHANMTAFAGHEQLPAFPTLKVRNHLIFLVHLSFPSPTVLRQGITGMNNCRGCSSAHLRRYIDTCWGSCTLPLVTE
jgi:hypothetical protein